MKYPYKLKKPLPKTTAGDIFREHTLSGQLVHLQGQAALLAGSVVLVQKTLQGSLVNRLNSNLVGNLGSSLVAGHQSGVELLQIGLQLGLLSLVLLHPAALRYWPVGGKL